MKSSTPKNSKEIKVKPSSRPTFSSELLLQQAIAGLLIRMSEEYGISGVQILQGSQELGKDLIFYIRGGFGETLLCACVVKNTKITGDAAKLGGARTILHQAEQAFDSVHTDSFGKEIRVERVYVITPFDLSPATIASIKGKLQERAGQVVFIGGPQLLDLFKKHWPDYFADEITVIEHHLSETKHLVDEASPLQELASQYNLGQIRNFDKKVYVHQELYREIDYYTMGDVIFEALPHVGELWGAIRDLGRVDEVKIQAIADKIDVLKRFMGILHEWQFCGKEDVEHFTHTSGLFISSLYDIFKSEEEARRKLEEERRRKLEAERQRKLEAEKLGRLKAVWPERAEIIEKEAEEDLVEEEAVFDYMPLAKKHLETLTEYRDHAINSIEEEFAKLKLTITSRKFDGVEALSDPDYLNACIVDEFARSVPEGIFQKNEGLRVCFPKDILAKWKKQLFIVGAPGFGKTSFCRWHALQDAENLLTGKSNIIPVYVPLAQFSTKPLGSFEDTFLRNLGRSALLGQVNQSPTMKVRLYLDGLDEIASQERRREIVELAKSKADTGNQYQIILTSRDYIVGRWLSWMPRVALGGLEEGDIQELIDKWLGKNTESSKRFKRDLDSIPMLNHLMRTPLLATLIIMVFRQTGRLPESKNKLYEIFINLHSGGWDLAKRVLRPSRFGERVKVMVLSNLAGTLHERRRREFKSNDIKIAAGAVLSGAILKEWELLEQEFIVDGLIVKSGDVMQFSHLSFQEYLAAKDFMGSPQPTRINRALDSYLWGDGWWKEVIKFYVGLSTNPAEVKNWLISRLNNIKKLSLVTVSSSQVEHLLSAFYEAFPGSSKSSLKRVEEALRSVNTSINS